MNLGLSCEVKLPVSVIDLSFSAVIFDSYDEIPYMQK